MERHKSIKLIYMELHHNVNIFNSQLLKGSTFDSNYGPGHNLLWSSAIDYVAPWLIMELHNSNDNELWSSIMN